MNWPEGGIAAGIAALLGIGAKYTFVTKGEFDKRLESCHLQAMDRRNSLTQELSKLSEKIDGIQQTLHDSNERVAEKLGAIGQYIKDH
jgi:archaellum component FlaC